MYIVRNTYEQKAWNYVMRQGYIRLSEGGLAHDVIDAIKDGGLVPQSEFIDIFGEIKVYNHTELVPKIKTILDAYIKNDVNSEYPNWKDSIASLLDKTVGKKPKIFTYENQDFTPKSFAEYVKIVPEDYVSLTSFTHEDYYSDFVLNIPDNFSSGSFYNLPLDVFIKTINDALINGYSISLDIDVSEKTFSSKHGVAVLPKNVNENEKALIEIVSEKDVTAGYRQEEFENYNTTDDHLMHITGLLKDQNGTVYYKVKNSWGGDSERVGNGGYVNISESFFKLKTISVLLHKDALDKKLQTKLGL